MKFIHVFTVLSALIWVGSALTAPQALARQGIAVVELFTSPGCSDTPTANAIFERIASLPNSNLILMSCHVTFFETEVKDPFARDFCDFRHDQYSDKAEFSSATTPEIIINGQFDTKGDKENIVRDGIELAYSLNTIAPIQMDLGSEDLNITLPELKLDETVDLWLFAYTKKAEMLIDSGPLKGGIARNINVATHAQKLLNWDGKYKNLNMPKDMFPAEGYIVIAQSPTTMKMVAAGSIEK